ncbi:VIT1/CCC1 transporter family protein [uncultured Sphingomonas sp.]|uniref:VIT1/CCC1 transporter family protein n=1 Tax=uncultured Sphingomonas sp. TaxID=158754 RepID=UPI002586C978|nr:VIT1/CCC1 transporter family protein [uncultured Sphingomonas sp.]
MTDALPHAAGEHHLVHRTGWLRAAVLGANDGIISVSSLIVGVAAAPGASAGAVLIAGTAALVGGALSMAAGEYVSVSSQADTERADLLREAAELKRAPLAETRELAAIYEARGVEPALAQRVAEQMMAHDALGAHRRDELGLADDGGSNPVQAALFSAAAFSAGAIPPVLAALAPHGTVLYAVPATALLLLALLGMLGARAGGAPVVRGMVRVVALGALAMAVTALIGKATGTVI